jgi:hypothetical protein
VIIPADYISHHSQSHNTPPAGQAPISHRQSGLTFPPFTLNILLDIRELRFA